MKKNNDIIVECNTNPFMKAFAGDFLIIHEKHPYFKKFLCNSFNQIWYFYDDKVSGHCFSMQNFCSPIIQESIEYDNMSDDEIIAYIYESLCQGYHVKTFVNEKYLPCKNKENDFNHDNNIYGLSFSENKVKFYGLNNKMFITDEASIEEFLQSFRNIDKYYPITRLKPQDDLYYFDFELIIYCLEEYLNSGKNNIAEKEKGYYFGLAACDKLSDIIRKIIEGKYYPDPRQIHQFMEYKKSMAFKVKYFKEIGVNISDQLISKLEYVYIKAGKNIMYLLKYENTKNKKYLYNIIDNITEIIEIDKAYIQELLNEIKLYVDNQPAKQLLLNHQPKG